MTVPLGWVGLLVLQVASAPQHPWVVQADSQPLAERIAPPPGFVRAPLPADSFGAWLRRLPVKAGRPDVRLHDGRLKGNQGAHHVVLDVDVGRANLQQCADAVMRLRAEYLRATGRHDEICFRFTSGQAASWRRWRRGERPQVDGNNVRWRRTAAEDDSYAAFRRYLRTVFVYAGSYSLSRELRPVAARGDVAAGDVFIQGGFPGHAVLVVDVARNASGEARLLLAQSYMPAQDVHVLRNPGAGGPWYVWPDERLTTPEWTFGPDDHRRFGPRGCPAPLPPDARPLRP